MMNKESGPRHLTAEGPMLALRDSFIVSQYLLEPRKFVGSA